MTSDARFTQLLSDLLDSVQAAPATAPVELQEMLTHDHSLRFKLVDHLVLDVLLQENLGQEPMIALVDTVSGSSSPLTTGLETTSPRGIVPPRPRKTQRLRWLAGFAGLVATLGLVFWQNDQLSTASAAELVEATLHAHAAAIERVYVVEVRRGGNTAPLPELPRDVRVATQGNRFWVQMRGQREWIWGRDERGAVWMTLGDHRAVVINPDEMGLPLRYLGDLYTLNLETLLQSFLRHCQLELSDETAGIRRITATPRRPWRDRPLRRAVIEVDRETGVIRQLVLERELHRISSVTTFTLVESRAADAALYGPPGHLAPSGRVLGAETGRDDRRAVMLSWLGSRADQWLRVPEAGKPED